MATTNLTPTLYTGKTILGIARELETKLGLQPANNISSTLNAKYNIYPSSIPSAPTYTRYFGYGIGGARNVNEQNLSQPNVVRSANMDLYIPIPVRAVPLEEDLSDTERANYRIRRIWTHPTTSDLYALYYLMPFTLGSTSVRMTRVDPNTGIESPYTLDYSNLNPTPPVPDINGVISDETADIHVYNEVSLPLRGSSVVEVIGLLYGGDMRYAKLSEVGLYLGRDQIVTGQGTGGPNSVTYTESLMTQLDIHHTWNGIDMSNPTTEVSYKFDLGKYDIVQI